MTIAPIAGPQTYQATVVEDPHPPHSTSRASPIRRPLPKGYARFRVTAPDAKV